VSTLGDFPVLCLPESTDDGFGGAIGQETVVCMLLGDVRKLRTELGELWSLSRRLVGVGETERVEGVIGSSYFVESMILYFQPGLFNDRLRCMAKAIFKGLFVVMLPTCEVLIAQVTKAVAEFFGKGGVEVNSKNKRIGSKKDQPPVTIDKGVGDQRRCVEELTVRG
jgi:hypothetical protein